MTLPLIVPAYRKINNLSYTLDTLKMRRECIKNYNKMIVISSFIQCKMKCIVNPISSCPPYSARRVFLLFYSHIWNVSYETCLDPAICGYLPSLTFIFSLTTLAFKLLSHVSSVLMLLMIKTVSSFFFF